MSGATKGTSFGLNTKQVHAAQLLARGYSEEDVMSVVFFINSESTPIQKREARRQLHKWYDIPGFGDCYRNEVKRLMFSSYGRAVCKIDQQIDNKNDWLANKAANDILSRATGIIMGEEDKKIVVQIDNGPEIGTPDDA